MICGKIEIEYKSLMGYLLDFDIGMSLIPGSFQSQVHYDEFNSTDESTKCDGMQDSRDLWSAAFRWRMAVWYLEIKAQYSGRFNRPPCSSLQQKKWKLPSWHTVVSTYRDSSSLRMRSKYKSNGLLQLSVFWMDRFSELSTDSILSSFAIDWPMDCNRFSFLMLFWISAFFIWIGSWMDDMFDRVLSDSG